MLVLTTIPSDLSIPNYRKKREKWKDSINFFNKNDKTERVRELGRKNEDEIEKRNQMTALRLQTGGWHQTSPASLPGSAFRNAAPNTKIDYMDTCLIIYRFIISYVSNYQQLEKTKDSNIFKVHYPNHSSAAHSIRRKNTTGTQPHLQWLAGVTIRRLQVLWLLIG